MHGAELAALAEAAGVPLGFEAAVAGGIPVIKALREGLAGNRIIRIAGILNGTCNYILTVMQERGRAFADVLADAQRLGYAEADPSFDIDGIDAAHKLAILAALAFGGPVDRSTPCMSRASAASPRSTSPSPPSSATASSCSASRAAWAMRSRPACIPAWSRSRPRIARVDGVFNAVVAEGDFVGRLMLEGRGAGAGPTASAVVADLIDIARGRVHPGLGRRRGRARAAAGGADGGACRRLLPPPDGAWTGRA